MTTRPRPTIGPRSLFAIGGTLLLVYVVATTFLLDVIVALFDPSQGSLDWLFTVVGVVSDLSIALGTAVLAAAVVVLGMYGTSGQGGRAEKWSIHLPRKRPLFLSDAAAGEVEAFAEAHGLTTEEAINRLVLSGLQTTAAESKSP